MDYKYIYCWNDQYNKVTDATGQNSQKEGLLFFQKEIIRRGKRNF